MTSPRTVSAVHALGVPLDRILVVEPGTEPANAAVGSNGGPLHLLCVASITPRKGHDTLLDALSSLLHLDWTLTCVGSLERDSAYAAAIAARCTTSPFASRVALAGELAGAALEAAYTRADIFVLPTHYEGYGMVIAGAGACDSRGETPTGAIESLVGDSAGVLVPPGDPSALAHVLERDDRPCVSRAVAKWCADSTSHDPDLGIGGRVDGDGVAAPGRRMSGFSAEWLALREPADRAARSVDVTRFVLDSLARETAPVLVDLGCGTGSNVRYLAPQIPGCRWRLVDDDEQLLSVARVAAVPRRDTSGQPAHAHRPCARGMRWSPRRRYSISSPKTGSRGSWR